MVRSRVVLTAILSFLFLLAPAAIASAAPSASFGGPSYLGTGYYTYDNQVGDLNNDGSPDLVVPMYDSDGDGFLRAYLNDGTGTFTQSAVTTISGSNCELADFNRDGNLDAIALTTWSGHNMTLARGDGLGGLSTAGYLDHYTMTTYVMPGDFNNDTIPDLLVGTGEFDNVRIYLGNGDFTFTLSSVVTNVGYNSWSGQVGDINRDGKLDFVVANYGSSTIDIRLGDGTGAGFLAIPDLPVNAGPTDMVLADFDRDGILDLAVSYMDGSTISIFDGDGTGNFTNRRDVTAPVSINDIQAADVNCDGTIDLVAGGVTVGGVSYSQSQISVLLGDGCGNFPVQVKPGYSSYWAYGLNTINIADIDGDARPDLVTTHTNSNAANNVGIFKNSSAIDHSLELQVTSQSTLTSPYRLASGDFNRDGKPDLAVGSFDAGMVDMLLGNAFDGLTSAGWWGGFGNGINGLSVVDANHDGIQDLMAFSNEYGVSVFPGDGSGGLTFAGYGTITGAPTGSAIDADRDGNADALAVADSGSSSQIFAGVGDGSLTASGTVDLGTGARDVAVADFNHDGVQDAATASGNDGYLRVAFGDGHGGFSTESTGPIAVFVPTGIEAGDIDGNGTIDLAVVMPGSGVRIELNDGTGTFSSGALVTPTTVNDVTLTDFDLNGTLDIVTCGTDGYIRYQSNDGAGVFTEVASLNTGTTLFRVISVDLDRDGRPDVAATGANTNHVYIVKDDTDAPYTTAVTDPLSPNGANGWFVTTPTVTFERNELAGTFYSLNGADWDWYDEISVAPITEGANTLSFWSIDASMHQETTQTATIKVDTVAPTTTAHGLPTGTSSTEVTFTLSATDADSLVDTTYYQLGTDPIETYTTTVTISAEGATEVSWWSVDNAGNTEGANSQTVTIDLPSPPTTLPDSYATDEDTTLTVGAPGVLDNDTDPDAGVMTAAIDTDPAHGDVTLETDGSFEYVPDLNWNGTDTFTYIASNAASPSDPETVTVEVASVNDAPTDISLSNSWVSENASVDTWVGTLTATDVESSSFTYSLVETGDYSAFSISGDHLVTAAVFDYETKNSYSVTIRVTDGDNATYDETFTINVSNRDEAPVAAEDVYETTEDETLTVPAPGVLGNDIEPDGSGMDATYFSPPMNGTLNLNANGSFTYVPDPGYHGVDTFKYRALEQVIASIADPTLLYSAPTTVTITVKPFDSQAPTTTCDAVSDYKGEAVITLTAEDDVTGVADTFWSLDGSTVQTGTVVHAVTTGDHTLDFWSVDNADNVEATHTVEFTIVSDVQAIEGENRYETAILASQEAFPNGAGEAVICRGDVWADVAGGSALAGAVDGPLLLTRPTAASTALLDELDRLGVGHVYILGSEAAISQDVEDALVAQLGVDGVTRIGGANRYDTSRAVAEETVSLLDDADLFDGDVFVATGQDFPDAIAAAPLATRLHRPIILTRSTTLSSEASAALAAVGATDVQVLGGTSAVSADVVTEIEGIAGIASVDRLAGSNRYRTAIAIAEYGVSEGLGWNGVAIASGVKFPDALAGGVMQGHFESVVLLTEPDSLPSAVYDVLHAHRTEIGYCRILGGTAAVSEAVRVEINNALQ